MSRLRTACVPVLASMAAVAAAGNARDVPAVLVYRVVGDARFTRPGEAPRPARPLEWLPERTRLEVEVGGLLSVVTVDGRRYDIRGRGSAVATATALISRRGDVRELPRLPPLPLTALRDEDHPGRAMGAIRVRADRIDRLCPSGTLVRASDLTLSFEPVGAARYEIEIRDAAGRSVLRQEVADPRLGPPPGALEPGARYRWTVRSLGGPERRGEGHFVTLPRELEGRRAVLQAAIQASDEPSVVALGAGVDERLGLLREARDGFRAALRREPDNRSAQEALERVTVALGTCEGRP
jgi:hypothetical protein